jgi:GntR family transcriptional regulator, arabinose operon transcriptional repressor
MGKKPLYEMIYQHYQKEIISGKRNSKRNSKLPTEKEIAKEFKVSRITVIRALTELELKKYIQRIQGSGSYVTEGEWKTLQVADDTGKKLSIISLVLPSFDKLSADVLKGVEDVAKQRNYFVTYHNSANISRTEKKIIKEIISSGSDGMILYPTETFDNMELYSSLMIKNFPLVLIDRKIPGLEMSLICVDNQKAFYELTNHLIELGHTRIIFVGIAVHSISSEFDRYKGFCAAHIDNGLPLLKRHLFSNEDIEKIPVDYRPKEPLGRRECHYLFDILEDLNPTERPTAIAAVNDIIAELIMSVALERGISIPDKYSVSGFDNLPFSAHLPVPLTTVSQPSYEIGRKAALELFERIKSPSKPNIIYNIDAKLITRDSTNNPRSP